MNTLLHPPPTVHHCRTCDNDFLSSSASVVGGQSSSSANQCRRCAGTLELQSPPGDVCDNPSMLSGHFEQLECNSLLGSSRCTPESSPRSESSADRLLKRRRTSSQPAGSGGGPTPAVLRPGEAKSSIKDTKKYKEQDARNGLKEQVKIMQGHIQRLRGTAGMTELNVNNSKTSGLKYKKFEVIEGGNMLIETLSDRLERREAESMQQQHYPQQKDPESQLPQAERNNGHHITRWLRDGGRGNVDSRFAPTSASSRCNL